MSINNIHNNYTNQISYLLKFVENCTDREQIKRIMEIARSIASDNATVNFKDCALKKFKELTFEANDPLPSLKQYFNEYLINEVLSHFKTLETLYDPHDVNHEDLKIEFLKSKCEYELVTGFLELLKQKDHASQLMTFMEQNKLLVLDTLRDLHTAAITPKVNLPRSKIEALASYGEEYLETRVNSFVEARFEKPFDNEDPDHKMAKKEYCLNRSWASTQDFMEYMQQDKSIRYPIHYEGGVITKESLALDIQDFVDGVQPF